MISVLEVGMNWLFVLWGFKIRWNLLLVLILFMLILWVSNLLIMRCEVCGLVFWCMSFGFLVLFCREFVKFLLKLNLLLLWLEIGWVWILNWLIIDVVEFKLVLLLELNFLVLELWRRVMNFFVDMDLEGSEIIGFWIMEFVFGDCDWWLFWFGILFFNICWLLFLFCRLIVDVSWLEFKSCFWFVVWEFFWKLILLLFVFLLVLLLGLILGVEIL